MITLITFETNLSQNFWTWEIKRTFVHFFHLSENFKQKWWWYWFGTYFLCSIYMNLYILYKFMDYTSFRKLWYLQYIGQHWIRHGNLWKNAKAPNSIYFDVIQILIEKVPVNTVNEIPGIILPIAEWGKCNVYTSLGVLPL